MEIGSNTEKPNAIVWGGRINSALFESHVLGKENINEIPSGKNIIIAATHLGDYDIPLVSNAVGDKFGNLTVAVEPRHKTFQEDPFNYLSFLIGFKHKFTVDFTKGGGNRRGKFDPENFTPMKRSLEEGKPLIIAAFYNPRLVGKADELLKHSGNGAAYLAQITNNSIILPVAVKTDATGTVIDLAARIVKDKKRINASVIIGKPFIPDHIEGIEYMEEFFKKIKTDKDSLSEDEKKKFSDLKQKLQEQSKIITQHLAELLS